MLVRLRILAVAALLAPGLARADATLDPIAKRLSTLEGQANDLEHSVRPPAGPPQGDPETIERRLIQAQVAYGVGRYADASLLLYDIVEKYPGSRSYPEALFYLADSLFQKGDNLLAKGYFLKIVDDMGPQTPHYADALERLIEISLRTQDPSRVQDYLAKLEQIPPGKQGDSVPYVRGKYAYHTQKYDEALRFFDSIPSTSKYYFQGRYFAGVTLVAKGDLDEAAKVFHALLKVPTKGENDENIIELSHLALGRIHYEREQPTDAIDHYLIIGKSSPYFDEALFEVAWVYVKAKQFDKALRALELLALADPKSARLPDVRILEGNLRIRKAQGTAVAQGNSAEEYAKASSVFEETRTTYEKPRADVERLLASQADPRIFFNQIADRAGKALEVQIELPPVVVDWLREEEMVKRAVGVSTTLEGIKHDLDETGALITRLERAVSSPSRVALFPLMAEKRGRSQEIAQGAFKARQDLATHERAAVERHASPAEQARLTDLQEARRQAAQKLAALPGSNEPYIERVRRARTEYIELDKRAQEIDVSIISLEAQLAALDRYWADMQTQGKVVLPAATYNPQMRELRGLIADLRKELDSIRNETLLASDEAGISDTIIAEETETRATLEKAIASEHEAMKPIVARMNGDERARLERIGTLMAQAEQIEATATAINGRIDGFVDAQLSEAKTVIVEEKGHVAEYQQLLVNYDGESVDVGGEVVGTSFDAVAKKFYEIGVRADVGLLDVAWSQHEQAQQSVEKLRQDLAQEKNGIEGELRAVDKDLEQSTPRAPIVPPTEKEAPDEK